MRRVIVESPFAAQTPPYEGEHEKQPLSHGGHAHQHSKCPRCRAEEVRKEERLRNYRYASAAMRDCLRRGEAPFASHRLYPGVLDDDDPVERRLGIEAGLAWGAVADATVVYTDLGTSKGMRQGIERAKHEGRPVEYRTIEGWK